MPRFNIEAEIDGSIPITRVIVERNKEKVEQTAKDRIALQARALGYGHITDEYVDIIEISKEEE